MDPSDSQNLFFEALAKIFGDGPSSFDGSFFRDSSIVSTLDQFSKTLLWMRNHPEIDFDIWIRSFDTTSVIIEYSNGLTRREHSVEETNLIRLSFLDNFLNRKGVVGFYQVLEKIEKVPKGTYFDSHHPSLHLFIRFSGGEIDVKEYESNKDYKNLRKKRFLQCACPVKDIVGVLCNGPFHEERIHRLSEISRTGAWDSYIPGVQEEVLKACFFHSRCEFNTDPTGCEGKKHLVTTHVSNHYAGRYIGGTRLHGSFYCTKHAPPSFMTPVWGLEKD